jgi:NTP pyrophosphatase (non-canonical NTP hydrolase)
MSKELEALSKITNHVNYNRQRVILTSGVQSNREEIIKQITQKMKIDSLYQETIDKFGKDIQLILVIEELSELIKVLTKGFRNGKINKTHLIDELADVYIMLGQLKMMEQVTNDELDVKINEKLERLKRYLETGKY